MRSTYKLANSLKGNKLQDFGSTAAAKSKPIKGTKSSNSGSQRPKKACANPLFRRFSLYLAHTTSLTRQADTTPRQPNTELYQPDTHMKQSDTEQKRRYE